MSSSTNGSTITLARGDGIGPEIADAVLGVLEMAGARLDVVEVDIGERQYLKGHTSGIAPDAWNAIRTNPAFLKGPITTPLGGGYKSLNVTIRKALNLFANVRPAKSYAPFVRSRFPGMNLVIVRENEEDLYAGIEHQQTPEVAQVLKLVTRPGSEKIIRYAFEYARGYGRRRVTCMTKNNIMKHTDGLFSRVFAEVAREYPDIEADHQIIDIGAARLADNPESFDVIVTLNLYGDILSDIASQLSGSVGIAGSANIGPRVSMFEAVHGSAPDIAGQDLANPSGLLLAATQMLVHLGQQEVAERIKNAWLATLEEGIHTADIADASCTTQRVGTRAFAQAVASRLGDRPRVLSPVDYRAANLQLDIPVRARPNKKLDGVDVFVDWDASERDPNILAEALDACDANWKLKMITNRGVKVWPSGFPETFCTDHWRCRFLPVSERADLGGIDVGKLLTTLAANGIDVIKTENLYSFDGERSYSLGQGE